MGLRKLLVVLPFLGPLAASAGAADLSAVPRAITKEPAYKTRPRYCLLVFGPEASKRVWVVLDGDTLYADKNGNGDLTDEGEAVPFVTKPLDVSDPAYPLQEYRLFSLGDVADGGRTYARVEVAHTVLKKRFEARTEFGKDMARLLRRDPGLTRLGFHANLRGKVRVQAVAYAADSPAKAPVVHIDGPLTMRPHDTSGLLRGDKPSEFYAVVGTRGLGEDTFAILDYTEIPDSAKPVLEVEFPAEAESGRRRVKVPLGRC